jgi:hypothetical protein
VNPAISIYRLLSETEKNMFRNGQIVRLDALEEYEKSSQQNSGDGQSNGETAFNHTDALWRIWLLQKLDALAQQTADRNSLVGQINDLFDRINKIDDNRFKQTVFSQDIQSAKYKHEVLKWIEHQPVLPIIFKIAKENGLTNLAKYQEKKTTSDTAEWKKIKESISTPKLPILPFSKTFQSSTPSPSPDPNSPSNSNSDPNNNQNSGNGGGGIIGGLLGGLFG